MDDDEVDLELQELLRQSLGLGRPNQNAPADTGVLKAAEFICNNSIDVAIDPRNTKAAAKMIEQSMRSQRYSPSSWSAHELHPKTKDGSTVRFIFTLDLLNFCFWDEDSKAQPWTVEYRDQSWTGYWALVASVQRALDEGIEVTDPHFWLDDDLCSATSLNNVFKSSTSTSIPLLGERLSNLKEAALVLYHQYDCSVVNLVESANGSAAKLVNILAENFTCFKDESTFQGKRVPFMKRAQIFVADLWACFEGQSYGRFEDIDKLTMFADYRLPQILHSLGCLSFSPPLDQHIRRQRLIEPGHSWEIQLRGCSIWCVEMIRRIIVQNQDSTENMEQYEDGLAPVEINAVLLDFFLYDTAKEWEKKEQLSIPHHRTQSIWY